MLHVTMLLWSRFNHLLSFRASSAKGLPIFRARSGNVLSFLLPLFQEGQLSVTGESMCTKYWLTAWEVWACPGKVWLG